MLLSFSVIFLLGYVHIQTARTAWSGEQTAKDVSSQHFGARVAHTPWPMYRHDLHHTGRSPYVGSQTNDIKWTFQAGTSISSSPVIGIDGTIYIGSKDKHLYAINPDGTLKWKFETKGE
ncbi:MAG: hypothetical protein ACYSR0_11900, partial [Planctomycetota bacterium]